MNNFQNLLEAWPRRPVNVYSPLVVLKFVREFLYSHYAKLIVPTAMMSSAAPTPPRHHIVSPALGEFYWGFFLASLFDSRVLACINSLNWNPIPISTHSLPRRYSAFHHERVDVGRQWLCFCCPGHFGSIHSNAEHRRTFQSWRRPCQSRRW